ncbi:hypothetical protein ACFQDN_16235 [Pseudomonas asuensis]
MRILFAYGRAYPVRTFLMLISLLLAGIAEGVGLTTLLPLLSIALGDQAHSDLSNKSSMCSVWWVSNLRLSPCWWLSSLG